MARIEHLTTQHAVGKHIVVPSSFSEDCAAANPLIDALWNDVLGLAGEGVADNALVRFAITTPADNEVPPLRINYTAAVVTEGDFTLVGALEHVQLEGGYYAVFPFAGKLDDLDIFYRHSYLEKFPRLGVPTRDGQHLEKILHSPVNGYLEIEVWIPIAQ
ncbi:MAG: GyrI-like domain-containing protein [Actinomycetes bacterium]